MLLAYSILLLIGLGVACLLWLPRGRKVGSTEPRCAACGYIVHGLPEPICPECGSDLSRPKAVVRSSRLPPGRLARSIGWTLFCVLALAMPLGMLWEAFGVPKLPQVYSGSSAVVLSYPASQAYQAVTLRTRSRRLRYPHDPEPPPDELKIQVTRSDNTIRELQVDPRTLHFQDLSAAQNQWSDDPLDVSALVVWLKKAGVQKDAEDLKPEMQIVMTQVRQTLDPTASHGVTAGTGFSGASISSGSSTNPLPWASRPPLVLDGVVWVIGLLWILLSRRYDVMPGDSLSAATPARGGAPG